MVISNSSPRNLDRIFWGFILLSFKHILLHAQGEVTCIREGNPEEKSGAIIYISNSSFFNVVFIWAVTLCKY